MRARILNSNKEFTTLSANTMSATTTTPSTIKTLTSTNLHDQLRQAMAQWQASAKNTHVSKALAAVMGSVRSHTVTRDGNWSTRAYRS